MKIETISIKSKLYYFEVIQQQQLCLISNYFDFDRNIQCKITCNINTHVSSSWNEITNKFCNGDKIQF